MKELNEATQGDKMKPTQEQIKEPRPPHCVCCEYMRICDKDRKNGQKIDYCPDKNYRKWFYSGHWIR